MTEIQADAITVLACQLDVPADMRTAADRDQHLQRTAELIDHTLQQRTADVVMLPELSSISYSRHCFSNPEIFAEEATGVSYDFLAPVAEKHHVTLMYGAPRIAAPQSLTISQFVIDANGRPAGFYDKLHLAQYGASMEKEFFSRGQDVKLLYVNGFRLSMQICYDMRFAGFASTLAAQHSVQAILHCVAFYRDESFYSWHPFVIARAMENQIYWLSLNRAGENFGASIFCSPWVDESAQPRVLGTAEECVYIELSSAELENVRKAYTFSDDRLEDYSSLS